MSLYQVLSRDLQVESITGKLWCQGVVSTKDVIDGSGNIIMDII